MEMYQYERLPDFNAQVMAVKCPVAHCASAPGLFCGTFRGLFGQPPVFVTRTDFHWERKVAAKLLYEQPQPIVLTNSPTEPEKEQSSASQEGQVQESGKL